jgi:nickel-dependent lactate racemase
VPGPEGSVLGVLAGDGRKIAAQGEELLRQAWRFEVPRDADLVIAAVGGGLEHQTWGNACRAAAASHRLVAAGGSIVLCSDINHAPGLAIRKVVRAEDRAATIRRLRRSPAADLIAATELSWALEAAHVYLMSRLPAGQMEDLGLTPVASAAEIGRLARRARRVTVLENAQYVQAVPG